MFRAAFYKGTRPGIYGLYNRFVRFWTRGRYSHMELIFSDGISASSSFLEGGVRFKDIKYNPDNWDFIILPNELEGFSRQWFELKKGKAYDYWAVIRFIFGGVSESKDKYQCAEACMESLTFTDGWRLEPNSVYAILWSRMYKQKNL